MKKCPPKGAKYPAYGVVFLARVEDGFVLNNSFNTSMPSLTAMCRSELANWMFDRLSVTLNTACTWSGLIRTSVQSGVASFTNIVIP